MYPFFISPMRAACPSYLILPDFIILILFCEAYKLCGNQYIGLEEELR